jgi:hypothetical protein
MTVTAKSLAAGSQLTTSAATYYTAPTLTTTRITSMTLTNTTAGAVTATVHVVPVGATESASNMVISARSLAAGETYNCPEAVGKVMAATGTIRALAGAATSISIQASGVEIV